jgi:hypothetical protein
MPHYKDGTEAKVGDQVIGKLYNTAGVRAGTIVSISPGADACNAQVAFVEPVLIDGDPANRWQELEAQWLEGDPLSAKVPKMAVWGSRAARSGPLFHTYRAEHHGASGPAYALFECADYCAVAELTKVGP